jgi:cyanophycin synthetase
MDYAHNPDGLTHIADLVANLRPEHKRVIAVLSGTGDRRDEDIRRLGEVAARMADELIIKETTQRRGRPYGDGPRLVREGALAGGLCEERVTFVEREPDAVVEALQRARPGDLVLIFADEATRIWPLITSFQPPCLAQPGAMGSPEPGAA